MTCRNWYYAKLAAFSAFPALPLLAPVGYYLDVPWLGPLVVFFALPLLDQLVGHDGTQPLGDAVPRIAIVWLRTIPRLYVFVWLSTLVWATATCRTALSLNAGIWLFMSVAAATAFATCAAHELLHWPSPFDRGLARIIMATVAYGQFPIEHLHHHATVGIVHEGTTPTFGQSVWSFVAKNALYTFRSAWRIERRRQMKRSLPWLRNRYVQQWILTAFIVCTFAIIAGTLGLMLFLVQAAFGIFTTEYVNYAQHYGLTRQANAPARGSLSWSSNGFVTNALTLNITRHAHHHLHSAIPYYELEHIDSMPLLPAGYLALFFPVMIPRLWRRIMDGRAQKFCV